MRALDGRRAVVPALIAGVVVAVALSLYGFYTGDARVLLKKVALRFDPTAERAFAYGREHFDARHPGDYDIEHAEYFYRRAEAFDPEFPFVNHELARIAFLRGDFDAAMRFINREIELYGDGAPNSFYVRGLIEGYMGDYGASLRDYERFLAHEPDNWATINDYAWVLLKAGRPREAVVATARGLSLFPDNPWLLNTNAVGLFELGYLEPAREQSRRAVQAVGSVTEYQWLTAYPGNDPRTAAAGVAAFKSAVARNMHSIVVAAEEGAVQ